MDLMKAKKVHISCGKVQNKIIAGEFEVWLLVEPRKSYGRKSS